MILQLKNGKQLRVTEPSKKEEIMEVWRNPKYNEDHQLIGKNNLIKKGDIQGISPEESEIPAVETKQAEKYYTVQLSYDDSNKDITIPARDLPMAMWAFVKETKVVLSDGRAFRGKDIISITPNKVASMGWNSGYKLQPYDQQDINKQLGRSLENYQTEIKTLIHDSPNQRQFLESAKLLTEKFEQKLLN